MSSIGRAWNPRVCVRARTAAILIVLAAAFALWGCGNDGGTDPIDDMGPDIPPRSTPQELMDYFEEVYAEQDSGLYAAMLHPEFTFHFLIQNADSLRDILGSDNFWESTLDLQSTGGLFRNPDVTGITLNIVIDSDSPSEDEDCVVCKQLETTIALRVSTVVDGTDPELVLTVDSPQTFFVRPDPNDEAKWVIWKQVDRPSSGGKDAVTVSATKLGSSEGTSWGGVKGFYR